MHSVEAEQNILVSLFSLWVIFFAAITLIISLFFLPLNNRTERNCIPLFFLSELGQINLSGLTPIGSLFVWLLMFGFILVFIFGYACFFFTLQACKISKLIMYPKKMSCFNLMHSIHLHVRINI